ncbi:MAG: hypothetical protein U0441_35585 [Polyangiaceae bacterium]
MDAYSGHEEVPIRVNGVWVQPSGRPLHDRLTGREGRTDEEFPTDLYEYLVNHEMFNFATRTFHVCTREKAAREALRRGLLPADFVCPAAREDCPMRRILAHGDGRSLRFERAKEP